MIPRTGLLMGAGPLGPALHALDPDSIAISRNSGAALGFDPGRLSAFRAGLARAGVRELVFAGDLGLRAEDFTESRDPVSRALGQGLGAGAPPRSVLLAVAGWLEAEGYGLTAPLDFAPVLRWPDGADGLSGTLRGLALAGGKALVADGAATAALVAASGGVDCGEAGALVAGARDGVVLVLAPQPGAPVDVPVLSPDLVSGGAGAGIAAIVFARGAVPVLEPDRCRGLAAAAGMTLAGV